MVMMPATFAVFVKHLDVKQFHCSVLMQTLDVYCRSLPSLNGTE